MITIDWNGKKVRLWGSFNEYKNRHQPIKGIEFVNANERKMTARDFKEIQKREFQELKEKMFIKND